MLNDNDCTELNLTVDPQIGTDICDSQPVANQQFYQVLDDVLYNLPKSLYIEKLLQLTRNNDDDICVYHSIKKSSNF